MNNKEEKNFPTEEDEYIEYMNAGMDEFDVLEPLKCPMCEKWVSDVFSIVAEKPFTASSIMAGLSVWGPYDVPKQIICEGHSWVHFRFLSDDSERLVLMSLPKKLKTKY